MSDIPKPPGAPSAGSPPPPPPPPPGNLTQPPGYAAYSNAPSSGSLARVGGLTKALVILVAVTAAAALLAALLTGSNRDDARDFLAGDITETEFLEAYLLVGMLGLLQLATTIAAFVLTVIVMFRLAKNHRALGRKGTWAPGWAIGGWFVPPLVLYVVPFLMFRELWKASDPDVPHDTDSWKSSSVHPVVTLWWVLYGLVPLALIVASGTAGVGGGLAADTEALAENIVDQYGMTLAGGAVTLLAGIAFIVMIRGLVARHRRLTGES